MWQILKDQDICDRIVTFYLVVVCTIVFILSWWLNKPVDLNQLLVLLAPILPHVVHSVSGMLAARRGGNLTLMKRPNYNPD